MVGSVCIPETPMCTPLFKARCEFECQIRRKKTMLNLYPSADASPLHRTPIGAVDCLSTKRNHVDIIYVYNLPANR